MAVFYTSPTYTKGCSNDSNKFNYYLTVDQTARDIANNQSTIKLSLYFYPSTVSNTLRWNTAKVYAPTSSITVDGTTYQSDINAGSATGDYYIEDGYFRRFVRKADHRLIAEKTLTISHNNDGTKSITIRFNWVAGSGSTTAYYPASFASNTVEIQVPAIPRGSQITCASSVLLDNTTDTFDYSVTSYADYWHTLSWELDGTTQTVWGTAHRINETTENLTISFADLLTALTSAQTKNLRFTLNTYSDSSMATLIGTTTKTVQVSVDGTVFKPSLVLDAVVPHSTPIANHLVAGYSSAETDYTVTLPYGAIDATVYFSIDNGTMQTPSVVGLFGTGITNILPASQSSYIATITAYAVDSRGVQSASTTVTCYAFGYKPPIITGNAYRTTDNVSTTEDASGVYAYIQFSAMEAVDIDWENYVRSVVCTDGNGNTYSSGDHVALPEENTMQFTVVATDLVASTTVIYTVQPAYLPARFYDDGTAQHLGVSLAGAIVEPDKVKLGRVGYGISPANNANGKELTTAEWVLAQGGGTIDTALDTTSTNAVENQAIATAIDNITTKTTINNAVTRSSGATITSQKLTICNNVAFLYLLLTQTTSVASNGDLFIGSINNAYLPASHCTGSGRYSAHAFGGVLKTDGTIDVRNISASAVTPSSGVWISFTYILGG